MVHTYRPRGVCSQLMRVEIENGIVKQVEVKGGCDGNLQGISRLIVGMVPKKPFQNGGHTLWFQGHILPDQLSKALRECLEKEAN